MPIFFNVHRTNTAHIEGLLNSHASRGWEVHHVRGIGFGKGDHLLVLFRREFATVEAFDEYKRERATQKNQRQLVGQE